MAVVGAIAWLAVVPEKGDSFTEFYILGLNGKADGYPKTLKAGDTGALIVGVVKSEHADVNYQVFVKMDDVITGKIEPVMLATNQKVQFLLYKDEGVNPYLPLNPCTRPAAKLQEAQWHHALTRSCSCIHC
jgi:uncharacterized membrane protein